MKNNEAICAGSFDPPTLGHINIVERGLKIFDKITVAIAINISKQPILSVTERENLLKAMFKNNQNVEVTSFKGLLVEFAKKRKCHTLLRGIRNMSDYEYESQMSLANKALSPELDTIFMMTEGKYSHLSSSFIKGIIASGGSCKGMIHPLVEKVLKKKLCDFPNAF
ncbi:MAG: pantetheine-phosphate adenylyltransferase [Deltaproteobacteria bacterium]|nr:pantetheine-phosphate adenylyltransferase [Deltaproteobacteria bacterium]